MAIFVTLKGGLAPVVKRSLEARCECRDSRARPPDMPSVIWVAITGVETLINPEVLVSGGIGVRRWCNRKC